MKPALPPDATLVTIMGLVDNQTEYVRAVLGNMRGYDKDCQVRLSINSNPRRPDYLIEALFYDAIDGEDVAHPQSVAIFNGRTHKGALAVEDTKRRLWSSHAMRFEAVQRLLGELRGLRVVEFAT
ncbi:hypothetical protein C7477_106138 [Phyllobacterium leguminum]|uniref:Uncharacterized protein n=2 Tax=Phyllobacterium leguminum TaxID=314237 RepID=A0A318T843_9HYPH|nr:hypothetical protein C7477_106138 [Phyllobacterium leguminum]